MRITTLYKKSKGQTLVITGHLNSEELKHYWDKGYRFKKRQFNKHGIEVDNDEKIHQRRKVQADREGR